jgi:prepilin-type N-terminal cleavage/methylation domain-containing protein
MTHLNRNPSTARTDQAGFTLLELLVSVAVWTAFGAVAVLGLHQLAVAGARAAAALGANAFLDDLAVRLDAEAASAFAVAAPNAREVDFTTELGGNVPPLRQYWTYRWDGNTTLVRLTSQHPIDQNVDVRTQTLATDVLAFAAIDLAPQALQDPFLLPETLAQRDARIPLSDGVSRGGNHIIDVTLLTRTGRTHVDLLPGTMPAGLAVRADYSCQARCRLNDCYALPTANPFINCKMFAGKSLNTCSSHVSFSFFGFSMVYDYSGRDSVTASVPFAFGGPAYLSYCNNIANQHTWYDNG